MRQAQAIYRNVEDKHPKALKAQTKKLLAEVLSPKVTSELEQLLPTEMVLSHNDINMTNCIIGPDGRLTLLDYEFACLNYLGFEMGNMFNEVATDYANTFEIKPDWELSKEAKEAIIHHYFNTLGLSVEWERQQRLVEIGRLLSHYFWMVIGLQSFEDSDCQLDLNYYIQRRVEYIGKYLRQLR